MSCHLLEVGLTEGKLLIYLTFNIPLCKKGIDNICLRVNKKQMYFFFPGEQMRHGSI